MAKAKMDELVRKRMAATQSASELPASNAVYETLFHESTSVTPVRICDLPLSKLCSFFTADIGFKPYPPAQLKAFAKQLQDEGLLVRIIVRPIIESDSYEILAGHNRVGAAKLAGWESIGAEVVNVDDDRAIVIATSTNLIQRQNLSIIERGKAYKALLDAKNRHGQRNAFSKESTFCDSRQKLIADMAQSGSETRPQRYNARTLVAEFFGVTEYEIRKTVKLTQLIPELQAIVEDTPKQLNLACADMIADYDTQSQKAFVEMCTIEGYQLNKATVQYIAKKCPPPKAERQDIFEAWREARVAADRRLKAPPTKISFDRKRFAPYLEQFSSEKELEDLFVAFLRERFG